jgi:protein SCO1
MRSLRLLSAALAAFLISACSSTPPAKRYPIQGQILAISTERRELTIAHGDIPGLMPAMTMTYPVRNAKLLDGRTLGEMVSGTLEVSESMGRIVELTHTGSEPLPAGSNAADLAAGVLDVGNPIPDTALIDQTNTRRALSDWKGSTTLITFIYTRCPLPNFCPLMDQNFAALQGVIAKDSALHGKVKLISITFDPEYDTPDVLAEHAKKMNADPAVWTFLTGDRLTIDRLAAKFGVSVLRTPGETAITHNLRTILAGPDGTIAKIYSSNDWTPGDVAADLRRLQPRLP